MVFKHLIRRNSVYVSFRVEEHFCATSEEDVFDKFDSPSTIETHVSLNRDCFRKLISDVLGKVSDGNVGKVVESG